MMTDIKGEYSAEDVKTKDYYVRLRGLPFSAKEPEIRSFFDGLTVEEVQIISTPDGRPSGEAFVGFVSVNDADQAMLRDKNKLGTRYVEVFRVTEPEFARIRNGGSYGSQNMPNARFSGSRQSHGVVRIRGLPYSCKQNELVAFFQGLSVEEVVFGKEPGEGGRPTGEGYVRFTTTEDAERAMQFNGQHLGKRYLELFPSDIEQFERFKRQVTSNAQPLNSFNYGNWNPWQEGYYDWNSYSGRGGGSYRGSHNGGSVHNYRDAASKSASYAYKDSSARPGPYDYHGRSYARGEIGAYGDYDYSYANQGYIGYHDTGTSENRVYLRGLPFRVNASQIIDFFSPLQCVDIELGYLPDGRPSGDGIVEFASADDVQEAMRRDRQMINNRYIEIFGPNGMRVAPGTTYKRIGGSTKPPSLSSAYPW